MASITDLAQLIVNSPDFAWSRDAACGDLALDEIDLFFVEAGRAIGPEAARMCADCPVRSVCLDHALERDLRGGYFGGASPTARRSMPTTLSAA